MEKTTLVQVHALTTVLVLLQITVHVTVTLMAMSVKIGTAILSCTVLLQSVPTEMVLAPQQTIASASLDLLDHVVSPGAATV
jgi:hypothetical protein